MKTDARRFALLSNGSGFARAVLQALLRRNRVPALLVLPEYPPARPVGSALLASAARSRFGELPASIQLDYAPRTAQAKLAERLRQGRFDWLLVACWPYLLEREVCESVRRCALNLHPSMLPAYRGPDPIGAQLDSRERNPGVSLHLLSPDFDRGDIVVQAMLPGSKRPRHRQAFEARCAALGAQLFSDLLDNPEKIVNPIAQASISSPECVLNQ